MSAINLSNLEEQEVIYSVTDGLSSSHTKKSYRKNFRQFLKIEKTTEDQLLSLAHRNPRLAESLMVKHIKHLEDQGLRHGSIKTHCFSIFHFFEMNDISLNKRKVIRFLPENEGPREDRAYTHQEIEDILKTSDERSCVVILLMASTGMRVGAVPLIQLRDLTEIPQYKLYKITVYASSPRDRYYTFCTPECKQAIDSYLAYRKRFGEILKPSSPLIREQFNIRLIDPFRIANPQTTSQDRVRDIVNQLLKRSLGRISDVKQSHGFRKFAITQMIKARLDYASREYLVGHKHSRGLDRNYDRTTEEDRLQEYLKSVDLLTINPENRLKTKIYEMETERSEQLEQIRKQMNEIRGLLKLKPSKP